jgi:hypothetical protein
MHAGAPVARAIIAATLRQSACRTGSATWVRKLSTLTWLGLVFASAMSHACQ